MSDVANNSIARLNIPASIKNGNNAVVELVSTEDKQVYWSWHLWFTDYKPSRTGDTADNGKVHQYSNSVFQTGIYKDRYIMDRDLGATIIDVKGDVTPTTDNATKFFGLFYQFGRKDPFIYANAISANTLATYYDAGGNEMPTPDASAAAGSTSISFLAKAVMNPTTFYTNSGNWTKERNGLWSELNGTTETDKSPFDPCPPGWRVPIDGTWAGFDNSNFGRYANGRRYTGGTLNINAYYPFSGQLLYDSGDLTRVGTLGLSRSATPNGQGNGYYIGFNPSNITSSDNNYGTFGFPVRCVQDRK